jgi:hypothetical protein
MVANGVVRKMEGHEAIYRACAVAINLAWEALNSKWNRRQQQTSDFLACSLAGRNGSAGMDARRACQENENEEKGVNSRETLWCTCSPVELIDYSYVART